MSVDSKPLTLPEPGNATNVVTSSQPAAQSQPVAPVIPSPSPSSPQPAGVSVTATTPAPNSAVKPSAIVPAKTGGVVGVTAPSSLSAAVNKASGSAMAMPKGLSGFNTNDLKSPWFHGMLYSETSARKTTTAAQFSPNNATIIILCRQKEQLIPLQDKGYNVLHAETGEAVSFAMQYPERAAAHYFGEEFAKAWLAHPERTLILDDVSEAIVLLLDSNRYKEDGSEYKDMRKVYGEAGKDLRELFNSARRKPQHIILIALAKVTQTPLTNEETIGPDMPPSMTGMLTTDLEYVFFIKKNGWRFITDKVFINYKDTDEKTGKEMTYRREIFAKNKIRLDLVGKGLVNLEEDMNLRQLWERIKAGKK